MDIVWVTLAFWLGTFAGFGLFALMQVARDADERRVVARYQDLPAHAH